MRIVGFLCRWCAYAAADTAGLLRKAQEAGFVPQLVPCSGAVDGLSVLRAFIDGADGVLVAGCHLGSCHYLEGNYRARRRLALIKTLLDTFGLNPDRLKVVWISAGEGERFANVLNEFAQKLQKERKK